MCRGDGQLGLGPGHHIKLVYREATHLGHATSYRIHPEPLVNAFRTTKVAANNDLGPAIKQCVDGGEAGADPEIIRHLPVVQRYVQI